MFKKLVSIILALTSCLCFSAAAMAAEPAEPAPVAAPRYVSGSTVNSQLTISGSKVTLTSQLKAKPGTTKMVVTQVLQQKTASGYRNVSGAKWTKTYTGKAAVMKNTYSVRSAGTYQLVTTAKITGPDGTETISGTSEAVTYR